MTARILIVEDHAIVREPLARLLRHEGYETECATNGMDALAAVKIRTPDLILLDLLMPKMDGVAFLKLLRADESTADIPVIVLTGLVECSATARIRELGVEELWQKTGFNISGLLEMIQRYIVNTAVRYNEASSLQQTKMTNNSWDQR